MTGHQRSANPNRRHLGAVGLVVLAASLLCSGEVSVPLAPRVASAGATAGAMAVDCGGGEGVQTECEFAGPTVRVGVHVTATPPSGYAGFQVKLAWNEDVLRYEPDPSKGDEALWPECDIAVRSDMQPLGEPSLLFACVPLVSPDDSYYAGPILDFQFRCLSYAPGDNVSDLRLVAREGDPQEGTHFLNAGGFPTDPALSLATVTCSDAPDAGDGTLAVDCDTGIPGAQSSCWITQGTRFPIRVHIVEAPANGMFGFQIMLRWPDQTFDYLPTANSSYQIVWSDCLLARHLNKQLLGDSSILSTCYNLAFPSRPLDYTGPVLEFEFQCNRDPGPVELSPPAGLVQPGSIALASRRYNEEEGTAFLGLGGPVDPSIVNAKVTCMADADADGCSDAHEEGGDPRFGGERNGDSFWDFFDTPDTANLRDQAVTVADISRLVQRFGSNDEGAGPFDRMSDPLSAPRPAILPPGARANYHPAFDRTLVPGGDRWDTGPPDGAVAIGDIARLVAQFGHTCVAPPN